VEITIAGGTLRPFDRDIIGDMAVRFFSDFKADIGIFGVGGIDDDGALLDFYAGEVQARQAIAANCRTSLLVADTRNSAETPPCAAVISAIATTFLRTSRSPRTPATWQAVRGAHPYRRRRQGTGRVTTREPATEQSALDERFLDDKLTWFAVVAFGKALFKKQRARILSRPGCRRS
jgi:hypothetical protein